MTLSRAAIRLTGWFPSRTALRAMLPDELLELAQLAEDMEIRARLAGDAYGEQVCRERRHLAEKRHASRLRYAASKMAAV